MDGGRPIESMQPGFDPEKFRQSMRAIDDYFIEHYLIDPETNEVHPDSVYLPMQQLIEYYTNPNTVLFEKEAGGQTIRVTVNEVFADPKQGKNIQDSLNQGVQILHTLFKDGKEVEPREEYFLQADGYDQKRPKYSSFSWKSFGEHTTWQDIIRHVVATNVTVVHTRGHILGRIKEKDIK